MATIATTCRSRSTHARAAIRPSGRKSSASANSRRCAREQAQADEETGGDGLVRDVRAVRDLADALSALWAPHPGAHAAHLSEAPVKTRDLIDERGAEISGPYR